MDAGEPIRYLRYGYWRWHRTLKRLAIRYRKPYVARHTSVSWNLMSGRNPRGDEPHRRPTEKIRGV
jgi:hypothetical protein